MSADESSTSPEVANKHHQASYALVTIAGILGALLNSVNFVLFSIAQVFAGYDDPFRLTVQTITGLSFALATIVGAILLRTVLQRVKRDVSAWNQALIALVFMLLLILATFVALGTLPSIY